VNERQKQSLAEKVTAHFGSKLKERNLAVWGLSFKPRTDDMREAPSITVIEALLREGARVQAFDPKAMGEARKYFGDRVRYAASNYEAAQDADALIIVTEWNEFRRPNFERLKRLLKTPVIFDGRNLYDPAELKELGFTYYSIGRSHG
jgi:UDPglucose 6-dehydrogenase